MFATLQGFLHLLKILIYFDFFAEFMLQLYPPSTKHAKELREWQILLRLGTKYQLSIAVLASVYLHTFHL
jgi:hypothetical protein